MPSMHDRFVDTDLGLADSNYEEFRFFTGLRQSEQIALTVHDRDIAAGKTLGVEQR